MPHHPTLFIGLGGSGGKTLVHLKRLLSRSLSRDDLAANYRFLLFDTDESAWEDLKREFAAEFKADPDFIDRAREWYSLGGFNPQRRWQEIKTSPRARESADILTWIDPQTAATFPDQIVTIGAEARRQLGRFCLAQHFRPVQTRVLSELQSLNGLRVQKDITRHVQIVIVTSSCGGTGSSIFFDMLYLLAVLYDGIARSAPFLSPVIFSPLPYIGLAKAKNLPDELIARYNANACAFFLELQYEFNRYYADQGRGSDDFVMPSWPDAQALKVNWQPFEGSALILDAQREGTPTFIPFENLYSTAAELLFYVFVSSVNANLTAQNVNFDRNSKSPSSGTYPRYSAAGFRALEYPGSLLERYLEDRFAADLVTTRFLGATGPSQGEQRKRAKALVNEIVLAPLRPDRSGTQDEHSFASYARRQYLEPDGNPLQRFRSIDDFCVPDLSKPDAPPKVDPSAITRERLTAAINEVHQEARALKTSMRSDFVARFGKPTRPEPETYYGRTLDRLQSEMENAIDGSGIAAWAGLPGGEDTGLAWHVMEDIGDGKQRALDELATSNDRHDKILGNVEGLERLKEEILAAVDASGGLLARWTGKAETILRSKLEAFATKRNELVDEAFRNVLLMLEIEVLSFVGSRDPEVRPLEYFTCQDHGLPSILRRLKDQGMRIRNWLGTTSAHGQSRLDATVAALREQSRSLLTVYEPPLATVRKGDGKPGDLASACLTRLSSAVAELPGKLAALTGKEGNAVSWRGVAPAPETSSLDLMDAFLAGARAFVRETIAADQELRRIVGRSIEDRLAEFGADQVKDFKDLLGVENVAVFSPISPGAVTNRPKFRLMVTASRADEGSVALRLGYVPGDSWQAHLTDPDAPHRVLAVKVYSGLYLEDDFPWVSEVRYYYDKHLVYEPHLWSNGRVRVSGGGSTARWRRAFAVGLAWGVLLQGDKWKKDDKIAALFTDRLKNEPDGYLHEAPFAIRRREPHFLAVPLENSMVSGEGRLECKLEGTGFEKVASAGAYGTAWSAFLKRPRMLESVEFFHKWCAGVTHEYGDDGDVAATRVVSEDRARACLGWLPQVLAAVRAKRDELDGMVNRSQEDESTLKTLGWVATELEREQAAIELAFQGETL